MLEMVCLVAASARAVNPISSVNFYTDGGCVEVCVGKLVPRSLEAFPMKCTTVDPAANSAAKLQASSVFCTRKTVSS